MSRRCAPSALLLKAARYDFFTGSDADEVGSLGARCARTLPTPVTAPLLVFGWGNPSRGDDALGPLFIERIAALALPGVECLTDFQLQVEDALELQGRQRVLFVDASLTATAPFSVSSIAPSRDASFSTHAITPAAVMQVYADLYGTAPPPCHLIAIRGEHFELGTDLSPAATRHLEAALAWARSWLGTDPMLRPLADPNTLPAPRPVSAMLPPHENLWTVVRRDDPGTHCRCDGTHA